jgi:hypothetical protein
MGGSIAAGRRSFLVELPGRNTWSPKGGPGAVPRLKESGPGPITVLVGRLPTSGMDAALKPG